MKWAGAREESWNKSQQGPRPVGSQARVQEEQQQSEVSEHYTTILHLIK